MSVRILFLLNDYLPPFRPDVNVLFGRELNDLGIKTDLVGQKSIERGENIKGFSWPAGRVLVCGAEVRGMLGELVRPLRDILFVKYLSPAHGIIQVRDKVRTGVIGLLVARITGKKFVYWMSFPFVEGFKVRFEQVGSSRGMLVKYGNYLRAVISKFVYYNIVVPQADHIFVQSQEMLEFMVRRGAVRERMTPVPMGVDIELFARPAMPSATPDFLVGKKVLAYLGVMGRVRNSEFLLSVLRHVRCHEKEAVLVLIGDCASADEKKWLNGQIQESGLSDFVWMTGWLPQRKAIELLTHAHVGLSPVPRGELFDVSSPTKVVEYLALGLPCVGNDIPDQKKVLDESGGGLCVPMEPRATAEACLKILNDSAMSAEMSSKGPNWVRENRSYPAIASKVAVKYSEIVGH